MHALFLICFQVTRLAGKWHGFMRNTAGEECDVSMFLYRGNQPDFVYGSIWKKSNNFSALNASHVGSIRIFREHTDGVQLMLFDSNFSFSIDVPNRYANFVTAKNDDETAHITCDSMNLELKKYNCSLALLKYLKEQRGKDGIEIIALIFMGFLTSFTAFLFLEKCNRC